jgi:allantoinase
VASDLAITGTVLVEGRLRQGVVEVAGRRIVGVHPPGTPLTAREQVTLAEDEVLLPGLVDSHVHVNEPGRTEWEGFDSATRAAAAGGVTTIVDMPLNSIPPTVDLAALDAKRTAAQGKVHVDVGFWGGAVPRSLGSLAALHEAGVLGFKCFLADSGVPEFPPLTPAELDEALAEVAGLDALLLVHAEDSGTLAHAPGCAGASYDGFVGSRPHEAEELAIDRLLEGAARHGARVHVLHLSAPMRSPASRRPGRRGSRSASRRARTT